VSAKSWFWNNVKRASHFVKIIVACPHYCLTDLSVDSNDITALVSGDQKHYFHLWGLQKPLVAFATRDFFRPHSWKQCFLLSFHRTVILHCLPKLPESNQCKQAIPNKGSLFYSHCAASVVVSCWLTFISNKFVLMTRSHAKRQISKVLKVPFFTFLRQFLLLRLQWFAATSK
jgi:hypothetical protein